MKDHSFVSIQNVDFLLSPRVIWRHTSWTIQKKNLSSVICVESVIRKNLDSKYISGSILVLSHTFVNFAIPNLQKKEILMFIWKAIWARGTTLVKYANNISLQRVISKITFVGIKKTENLNVRIVAPNFTDQHSSKIIWRTFSDVRRVR